MRIHGLAMGVPALNQASVDGSRSTKFWAGLTELGCVKSLSSAPLPEPYNFAFRLRAWLCHAPPNRFGQTNLRPDIFDLRSRQAVLGAQAELTACPEAIVLQEGFFFSPEGLGRPYAVYVDATAAIVARSYPAQVPWHDDDIMRAGWMRRERRLYEAAVRVFTYSEYCRQSVVVDYEQAASKVTVAYPGTNYRPESEAYAWRDPMRVLFVGYDFVRKGGIVLLEAWREVRRRCPSAELVIAGPEVLPPGLPEGVRFVGRVDGARAVRELYDSASVFCMPSLYEAYGHVFVEAMASGLPCVGCDAFAMPEIINPGEDGLLVPPGSVSALAEALIRLLQSPAEVARMSASARKKAAAWPTWTDTARLMTKMLRSDLRANS